MTKSFEEAAKENALYYYDRMILWQWVTMTLVAGITALGVLLIVTLADFQTLIERCAP